MLIALLAGFLVCFVPAWTLTFLAGTRGGLDEDEIRVFGNVWYYIGGVLMQDGLDGLDWRLRKCYRFRFPKVNNSIIIGSWLYESTSVLSLSQKRELNWTAFALIRRYLRGNGLENVPR